MSEQNYKIKIKEGNYEFEIQGDKEFVEKYYVELKEEFFSTRIGEHAKLKRIGNYLDLKQISLIDFYKSKQPQNHSQTIAVIAYWLLNNQTLEDFQSTKDLLKAYNEIKLKKPGNIHQHISELKKEGLIMAGSNSGSYKLTLSGIEYVENNLPKKKNI